MKDKKPMLWDSSSSEALIKKGKALIRLGRAMKNDATRLGTLVRLAVEAGFNISVKIDPDDDNLPEGATVPKTAPVVQAAVELLTAPQPGPWPCLLLPVYNPELSTLTPKVVEVYDWLVVLPDGKLNRILAGESPTFEEAQHAIAVKTLAERFGQPEEHWGMFESEHLMSLQAAAAVSTVFRRGLMQWPEGKQAEQILTSLRRAAKAMAPQ